MKQKGNFNKYFIYDVLKVFWIWALYVWYRPKKYYVDDNARNEIKAFKFKGGCLVTSNHYSFKEPIYNQLTFLFRRHYVIGAKDIPMKESVKKFCTKILAIYISRDNLKMSEHREIVSTLKDDRMIHIYAEGHCAKDPNILEEFKDGPVYFACFAKKPIIPIYYKPRLKKTDRLKICVGSPIYMDDVDLKNKDSIHNKTLYLYQKTLELKKFMEDK